MLDARAYLEAGFDNVEYVPRNMLKTNSFDVQDVCKESRFTVEVVRCVVGSRSLLKVHAK